jgi:hypothetical protein
MIVSGFTVKVTGNANYTLGGADVLIASSGRTFFFMNREIQEVYDQG